MPVVRISGPLSARPAPNAAVGARFYATDTEVIYVSTGGAWHEEFELPYGAANGVISGKPLSARPEPSTCVGWLFIDENSNEYEAFPQAWAPVNQIGLD